MRLFPCGRNLARAIPLAIALLALRATAWGDPAVVPEYEVKAALLYHFALLTNWPPLSLDGPEDPLVICVVGPDPFGAHLTPLTRKTLWGHPIEVRRHEYWSQAAGCDVVFVSQEFSDRARKPWQGPTQGLLTVSDLPGFARDGGILELTRKAERIGFNVNLKAAEKNGLGFSPRMLALAQEWIR